MQSTNGIRSRVSRGFFSTRTELEKYVWALRKQGCTQQHIAKVLGVSQPTVHRIIKKQKAAGRAPYGARKLEIGSLMPQSSWAGVS